MDGEVTWSANNEAKEACELQPHERQGLLDFGQWSRRLALLFSLDFLPFI